MILRDRMLYAGIRTSRRFAALSWFQRDFFYGLISVADDYGRFEADAEVLRTVLYGLSLGKVTERDVQGALLRFAAADIGLVKLYTVSGRGYGKVLNFRQTLQKRRGLYPDEEGGAPPEPELWPAFSLPEGKKEGKSPPPPAEAGGRNASLLVEPERAEPRAKFSRRPTRRLPKLEDLREDLRVIEAEMTDILRPGGCAFNVQPTGAKADRLEKLFAQREALTETIERTREALAERAREETAA